MNGIAWALIILAVLLGVLLAGASRVSEALVRARARRLPTRLALRMEEEWRGELQAISSRPGKLAFAVALMLTPRRAFVAPGEDSMTVVHDRAVRLAVFSGWKLLVTLPTVVLAVAAYAASYLIPVRYESEARIVVRPEVVRKDLGLDASETPIADRLSLYKTLVLSRKNLESIIKQHHVGTPEFPHTALAVSKNTGRRSRESMAVKNFTMDDAVEEMLSNITIRFSTEDDDKNSVDALFVSYVGPDPEASKAVAQSLVERLLASHREDLHRRLMGSLTFVQDELHKLSFRLAEEGRELAREKAANGTAATSMLALDYELRQSTYRSLFARNEELQLLASIYQRRGGMLQIVDPPQLGIPVEPNRMAFAIVGAIAGVVLGGAAFMGINRRQRRALA